MNHTRRGPRAGERGNALVISLLMLVLLTVMGVTLLAVTKTETQITANDTRRSQSLYEAEAGVNEGLARMFNKNDATNYIGEANPLNPTAAWGRYIVLANGNSAKDPNAGATASDGRDNNANGQVDEAGEKYPEVTSKQNGSTVNYPWVKVRYKLNGAGQVVRYGGSPAAQNVTTGYPVLRVSAEGNQGTAIRRLDIEAVKPPGLSVNAAIYTEDDNFKFNGTQFTVDGHDHDPATGDTIPGAQAVPGIATTMNPANITAGLSKNQENNVEGSGATPSVTASSTDYDLQAIVNVYKNNADIVDNGGTYTGGGWGGLNDYHTVYVKSDLHTSGNVTGGGLLLINGSLQCTGQFTWYGLVVCLGDIDFSGGGQGIHIYGGVQSTGHVTGSTVGGQADIWYSSATITKLSETAKYVVSRWQEN